MRFVLLIRKFAVAHFKHIGIVPTSHARVFIELGSMFVQHYYPFPIRVDIGGSAPQIACLCAPFIRLIESPFAYGEGDRFFLFSSLFCRSCSGFFESLSHLVILQCRRICAACDGIGKFYHVDSLVEVYDLLKSRRQVPEFLMWEFIDMFDAVDVYKQRLVVPSLLFNTQSQYVFAVFIYCDTVELCSAFCLVKTGDIISAFKFFMRHKFCKSVEFCLFARHGDACFFADAHYLQSVYKGSVSAVLLIVTEVILKIFDAPSCKIQRVLFFVVKRRRQIFAGESAVGGVNAYFKPKVVELCDKRGYAALKAYHISLQIALFVAHVGMPIIVDIDKFISRVGKSFFHHRLACVVYQIFVDCIFESIPTCPTHRGSERCVIVVFLSYVKFCGALSRCQQHLQIARRTHPVAFHKISFLV